MIVGIGAVYLAYQLIRRGVSGLTMPDLADVARALDTTPTTQQKGDSR